MEIDTPTRDFRPAYANYEQPRMGDNNIRANTERAVNEKLATTPKVYILALLQFRPIQTWCVAYSPSSSSTVCASHPHQHSRPPYIEKRLRRSWPLDLKHHAFASEQHLDSTLCHPILERLWIIVKLIAIGFARPRVLFFDL
ncbi:hypothetical protein D9619_013684 [Psilocybe cf. subviscida]|uniref:Uncharacterized protein n=1 Tax=Psilocybe cf. subviscida TaxID=2480587 RepID=A0A8H5AZD2_9AGAR|nr:hypothetical protein D9619_013684 [Psilocybe cf. subviscida]